jgi:D-glycero-D-manno-heptose 1,7-bisphosphate phosphatase
MRSLLEAAGAPPLDAVYFCPHHPEATLPEYRVICDCRKPRPGLLLRAAGEHGLDLGASFMVGDRLTDIAAGAAAACRTVLVQTGRHAEPPIVAAEPPAAPCRPDHTCPDLPAAAAWILGEP